LERKESQMEEKQQDSNINPSETAEAALELLAEVKGHFEHYIHMACDECGKLDSPVVCSQCQCMQYCNEICQKAAWKKGHKKDCLLLKESWNTLRGSFLKLDVYAKTYDQKKDEPCCICFETVPFEDLLQLPCHHVYCVHCITKVEDQQFFNFSCPTCRKAVDVSLLVKVTDQIHEMIIQAEYYLYYDEEKYNYYVNMARMEWKRLNKIIPKKNEIFQSIDGRNRIQSQIIDLRLLLLERKDDKAVIALAKEYIKDKAFQADPLWSIEILYCFGVALERRKDYRSAVQVFKKAQRLIHQYQERTNYDFKTMFRRVANHMLAIAIEGQENEGMVFGMAAWAIDLQNSFDVVLEMMSRYYKERKNDWENAIQCLRAAVRYECPCVPGHREMMKGKLRKLIEEKEAFEKNGEEKKVEDREEKELNEAVTENVAVESEPKKMEVESAQESSAL
jgi:hypothetical protein